jgi:DNA-binding response OmpR family regulator
MSKPSILVVEDTEVVGKMVQIALEMMGMRVRHALRGSIALDFVAQELPDAIILDLGMPDMNGWEFLERFRAAYPQANVPVIVASAFVDADNRAIGRDRFGVACYLGKPYEIKDLRQAVRDALKTSTLST